MILIRNTAFIFGVITFALAWYQHTLFIKEWREDIGDVPFSTMWRLSSIALFSRSLSERCKKRRNKVAAYYYLFFLLTITIAIADSYMSPPKT